MEFSVRFLIRYGNHVAIKKCGLRFQFEDLVSFVYTKWPLLVGRNFKLTCVIADIGEVFVDDDDDFKQLIALLQDSSIDNCDIHVMVEGRAAEVPVVDVNDANRSQFVQYDPDMVDSEQSRAGSSDKAKGKKLLSADWKNLIVEEGQVFEGGADQFRKDLVKFSVQSGFEFVYTRNEPHRVTAECKFKNEAPCNWKIHAFLDRVSDFFIIDEYDPDHQCDQCFGKASTKRFTSKVIIDLIADDIRNMPGISPSDVRSQVRDKFGLNISYYVAWRATDAGRSMIFGDHSKSYSYLPAYFTEAKRTNPDSQFNLEVHTGTRNFKRCFFAFGACLEGFNACRPVLMIDGTFLKGKHRGMLLSAVGKDANEGLFPVAFAIVSEETDDDWQWFLENLKRALTIDRRLVFVSDRNHGILEGVKKVFPDSNHGYCYKHLTANLKDKLRGAHKSVRNRVLKLFADCAYATTKEKFDTSYAKLLAAGREKVSSFMSEIPKERWSNAYFEGRRYGQMTSNGCESWNSQIRDQRVLPITNLIDSIRTLLMKQMNDRREKGSAWTGVLCKNVDKKMRDLIEQGRSWAARQSSEYIWEVFSSPNAVVDLLNGSCSCNEWQISGIPCAHAALIIFVKLHGAYDYIDQYYHKSKYFEAYKSAIVPFVQPSLDTHGAVIDPPGHQARRGRPKRKRIPSRGEKITRKMKCGRCGGVGNHNKKTCSKPIIG